MEFITLNDGTQVQVDPELYEALNRYHWTHQKRSNGRGYAIRFEVVDGIRKTVLMHRVIADTPPDLLTDHVDGNTYNNRRCNLRVVTKAQNAKNRSANVVSTSKYVGVSWIRRVGKWVSQIKAGGRVHFLGYFDCEELAARERDRATKLWFGEHGRLNFPQSTGLGEAPDCPCTTS